MTVVRWAKGGGGQGPIAKCLNTSRFVMHGSDIGLTV